MVLMILIHPVFICMHWYHSHELVYLHYIIVFYKKKSHFSIPLEIGKFVTYISTVGIKNDLKKYPPNYDGYL